MTEISVCIATFNGEKYIRDQISSILGQLSQGDEIIITDDGSTDNTLEILEDFKDPRIKIHQNKNRLGPVYNFENALSKASNQYIFLADQDDIWNERKIKTFKSYLSDYDVVVSDCSVVDNDLNITNPSFYALRKSGKGLFKNFFQNSYLGCCMAFHRQVLKKALPFPPQLPMHDIWLGLVTELFFKSIFIEDKLILFRRHHLNATITSEKSNHSLYQKFVFRKNLVFNLIRKFVFHLN
ncbi:MAG: glycosyltransferase [Bacteroidetes bacterium]|nr:glycosyltransferase [Bacteroidota bacterium]MCZ6693450.1 glycosyltransferase [Bacteroidota bacterium]